MKVGEALSGAQRVMLVYEKHQSKSANIEYSESFIDGATVYSIKGTSKNKEKRGWVSLVRDIISDIRFMPRKHSEMKCYVPGGFLDAGVALANDIVVKHDKSDRIRIEGHSLGGAAGLIAGNILLRRGYKVEKILAIGAPKTGKLQFVVDPNYKCDCVCLRNGIDIVPSVPPFYWSIKPVSLGKMGGPIDDHELQEYITALSELNPEDDL